MVPTCGLSDHVTAVFDVPPTVGVNVVLCPPPRVELPGERLIVTFCEGVGACDGCMITLAVAILVGSATLVAVNTTDCAAFMEFGAV
jgi:hypothetical protein